MSDDRVRTEGRAVATLRQGVVRYAEEVRAAMSAARKEVEQTLRRFDEEVQTRQRNLERSRRELQTAQAALARCTENCSGLERAVRAAASKCEEAERRLRDGKRALQEADDARADLNAVLRSAEAAVSENGSVASSALADLDTQIQAIVRAHPSHSPHSFFAGLLGAVEIASTSMGAATLLGDTAHGLGVQVPVGHESVAELRADVHDQETDFVAKRLYKLPEGYEIGDGKAGPHGA